MHHLNESYYPLIYLYYNENNNNDKIIKEKVEKMLHQIEIALLSPNTNFFKIVEIQDLLESSFVSNNNNNADKEDNNYNDKRDTHSLYQDLYTTLPTNNTILKKKQPKKSKKSNGKKNYEIRFRGSFLKRYAWLFIKEYKYTIKPIQTIFEDDETLPASKKIYEKEQEKQEQEQLAILEENDHNSDSEWNFSKLFYCNVLQSIFNKNINKNDNDDDNDNEENVEETLSYIYTLRYLSTFLLHNYNEINTTTTTSSSCSTVEQKENEEDTKHNYLDILLDPTYILERFYTFGKCILHA